MFRRVCLSDDALSTDYSSEYRMRTISDATQHDSNATPRQRGHSNDSRRRSRVVHCPNLAGSRALPPGKRRRYRRVRGVTPPAFNIIKKDRSIELHRSPTYTTSCPLR